MGPEKKIYCYKYLNFGVEDVNLFLIWQKKT